MKLLTILAYTLVLVGSIVFCGLTLSHLRDHYQPEDNSEMIRLQQELLYIQNGLLRTCILGAYFDIELDGVSRTFHCSTGRSI